MIQQIGNQIGADIAPGMGSRQRYRQPARSAADINQRVLRPQPVMAQHFHLDDAEGLELSADRLLHRPLDRRLGFQPVHQHGIRLLQIELVRHQACVPPGAWGGEVA